MTPGISQIGPPRTFLSSDRGAADGREVIGLGPGLACLIHRVVIRLSKVKVT
jgi:hypothetical protein